MSSTLARRIPVDPEFYRGILSPSEFNAVVDWRAVQQGQFAKALGRRGALCALSRRIKQLRGIEVAPPPIMQREPAGEPEVEIIEMPPPPPPLASSTPAAAATSYIQKVGAAASQFMLMMSSATTDFVNETSTGQASSSTNPSQCPICFDTVKDPYMGRCSHIYCKDCLMNPQMQTEQVSEYGGIQALRVRKCPQCRREGISFYKMLPN